MLRSLVGSEMCIRDRAKVLCEEAELHEQRSLHADEACGVGPLPAALQRVDWKIKGALQGSSDLNLGATTEFPMLVRFDGPNVMEGVKQLVRAGVVEMPMPAPLSTLLDKPCAQILVEPGRQD
eukprot:TRINITY_DN43304_c0_g1_i1.p2 TRINITY_DN43304_c0_g1~~TRINITY_DN43304_c0_g1_i1.p2  ORF type:complete len:123 (+),score=30.53 TRINITY_DN43304_c0_g1_i1:100-468(+)